MGEGRALQGALGRRPREGHGGDRLRTIAGLSAARARGKKGGRPRLDTSSGKVAAAKSTKRSGSLISTRSDFRMPNRTLKFPEETRSRRSYRKRDLSEKRRG